MYKNKAWEFQSEWRYKLTIFPGSAEEYVNKSGRNIFKDMVGGKKGRPCGFYDRKINPEALRKMRITKSLHIAKLNGRIYGAKRSHSVSEQPNCYQSV